MYNNIPKLFTILSRVENIHSRFYNLNLGQKRKQIWNAAILSLILLVCTEVIKEINILAIDEKKLLWLLYTDALTTA